MLPVLARTLSIVGHPICLLPIASLTAMASHNPSASLLLPAVIAFAAMAFVVSIFSWWQVRSGRWQHIDASQKAERRSLNYFLTAALFVAAFIGFRSAQTGLYLGFLVSGLLVVFAIVCSGWFKMSLHVAFAVFSATLLWRVDMWLVVVALCLAAGIAWSRLVLGRHTRTDVVVGALAGGGAGWLFWFLLFRHLA